ncbi:MAG: hypothetical protein NWE86_04545 [Candidatus Bathyarchaeota archaeon]|nr:hypothetical protein [Candidatus Bathyarchaeota archaeon]
MHSLNTYAQNTSVTYVISKGSYYLEKGFTLIIEPNSAENYYFTIPSKTHNATIKGAVLTGGFIVKPILGVPQTIGFVIRREDGTVSIATETSSWEGVLEGLPPDFSYELVFANRDMFGEREVRVTITFEYSYIFEDKITTSPSNGNELCLIATAFFGTALEPEVNFLRHVRDDTLSKIIGKDPTNNINNFYYTFSPLAAEYIRNNYFIRISTIMILLPMIAILHFADAIITFSV